GVLVMTNENDYVKVEGELYVSGFHDFRDRNDVYVENTLTAGTLELEGNFCQNGRREAFRASGSHRTILRGDGVQAVQMESADSWFNILDLQNDLSEYIFGLVPCWAVLTRNGEPVGDEAVAAIPYTASVNEKDKTLTILSWKDESAEIVIPDQLNGYTVTGIGREVFRNRTSMEGITLPANLTEIGEAAFRGCTALTGIEFPAALKVIGSNAFRDCTSLTTVTFSEGSTLETIRNSAFENDKLLESVAIPEGTSKIGEYAFYGCSALKKVTMPGTVNEMGIQVFRNTALTTAGPTGSGADYELGWTTEIPAYGFDWIDTLTEITLPEGITKLGRNAIAECRSLTQVGLPASLRTMGEEVFSGCEKLPRIDFPNGIRILPTRALRRCLALKEVSLPASLTTIKNSAFERCESLEEIVLPEGLEEIESYAFTDCKSLMGVAFPEGLTYLPDRCLINCRSLEEVTLPDSLREIRGWAFENCESLTVLEIPDGVTTIRSLAFKNAKNLTQLIVPESVTTLDNDAILETNSSSLVMYVVPGSTAEQYAIDHGISYENLTNTGSAVSVKVTDPNGETIVNGYSVSWYASDSDTLLGTGKKLRNVQAGTQVVCRVILNEELGSLYIQPDDVTYTAGSTDGTAEITLRAFETITVRGTVKDAEGAAIPNAALELKQTLNGMYDKTVEAQADEAGAFTLDAKKARAALTVSAEGYYDGAYAVSESSIQEGTAVVNAVLEKIPADKITLTLGRQAAAVPGEEPEITVQTNANGLVLSVYNETKQKSVKDFRFQYPYLNLGGDAAAAGDRIRLSLQDENKVLTAEDVTVTLDENRCGSAEWLLVENGKLRLDGIKASDAENSRSTVMIFDASGRIMESGTAAGSYASKPLSAGDYTLVLIEKTALLQGLDSFGRLAELGLAEGTDFVRQNVTINNGVITVLENVTVPDLDETKLYYTVDNATRFWTAAGKVTTGQYVTLRATYEIDRQKAAQTSGETLTFEIPDGLTFVQGSLTSDGRAAACTVQEDDETGSTQVTVRMNTGKGTVRFYVVPTSSGVKKAHAYLSFKKGTEDVMQPVGAVSVGVEAASISVPSRTGFKKVTVSGKTARGSEVTVYDNGQAVGTTETNKNGTWSLEFDLVRPLKYSYHEIYAQVENSEYGDIETEKAGILYNANFVQVSKVTMINTAHPSSNLRPTEYRTVFDFLHPESTVPTYNYWPSYPTFTFLVEFTGESVEGISNVRVITTNAAGDRTAVTCTYDEAGGVWVGTRDYRSFSDVPCKVAVKCDNASGDAIDDSMDMDDMAEFLAEARNIDESAGPLVEEFANIQNETIANERVSFDFTAGDEKLGEYSMVLLDYADFDLEAWKKDRYVEFEGSDGSISYEAGWLTDETYTIYTAYPDDEIYIKEVVRLTPGASAQGTASKSGAGFRAPLAGSAVYDPARKSLSLDEWTDTVTAGYKANGDIGKGFKQITGIQDAIDLGNDFLNVGANESTLRYALGEYKNAIIRKNCKCITKDMKDGYWRDAEDIEKQIDDYVRRANILMGGTYAAGLVMDYCGGKVLKFGGKLAKLGCKKLYKAAMKRYGGKVSRSVRRAVFHGAAIIANEAGGYVEKKMGDLTKYVTGLFDVKGVVQDGFISLRDYIRNSIRALNVYKCPCEKGGGKCECDPNQEDPDEEPEEEPDEHGGGPDGGGYTGIRSATPIADPSGYVYEAVPSNRVEGVTATIYQYAEIIDYDEYGEETGRRKEEVKWDAENYDQVNPQTTDTYGIFGWDVPEGSWVVKFNKEGYEDADSYNDAAATYAGENGKHYLPVPPIQTEVNTAMVSTAAPEVAGVSAYEGEIDIDFSQYMQIDTVNTSNVTVTASGGTAVTGTIEPLNAEDNYDGTARYASSFAFRPAQTAGALSGTVTVAVKNVKNYAGTAIAAAYSGQHAVTVMPRSLEITGETGMLHHDSTELTIRVLPAEAGAGRTLTITSYSPSIVSVGQQTVTTDENGLASVTLEGSLPGQGILEIALDGTKIAEEKQITVTARQAASAIRSLEDGNAAITLETEGLTYDGREKKPAVRVSYDGSGLEEGTDYTVTYSNNIKAGTDTAKVTVTGTGLYEGTLEQTFSIARAALASADVTLASGTYTYNGKSQKPAVTVKHGGKKLASGTDYSVTYSDNVHAGTASVKVAGKGNYKGTVTKKFTIAKAAQSIKLTVDATKIAVGKTTAIKVSGTKGSISFKSASEKLATVKKKDSKTGTVKAVKVGKVKITVTAAKTSDFNAVSKAVTISVVPAATSTFKADNQVTGIMLTWKKVAGANAYIIYRGSTQIAAIKNGSTVTYTDKKANTNGTKYTYKIIASASSTGRSTLSKSVTTYRVARPAISTLTNSGAKKMTVKWGKNAKASGYQIQYSTDKTFKTGNNSVTISGASTVAKAITGLTKGKTYYVRIRTFKTAGSTKYFSAWSPVKNVKITK
ncbi:Fibronectin type III domain-containing protein, partial [Sarcina sp. DSM 11001]